MGNTKLLQSMLDRGFGLFSINDVLSLQIYDDTIKLCITPLPGWTDEPVFYPIESRHISGILSEAFDYAHQFMTTYAYSVITDILQLKNIIASH